MLKTHFALTDRFGQIVELTKVHSDNIVKRFSELELLFFDFENFMSSLGYPKEEVDLAREKVKDFYK